MAGLSNERDAEYMAAEGLAAAADDYLAADKALRVFIEAVSPPGGTMQQHVLKMGTVRDHGEPPWSDLAVTGAVHVDLQQEPSPPVKPFPLSLDKTRSGGC